MFNEIDFLKYCVLINPNFKLPKHVFKIAALLDKFINYEITRLIISLPPRMGKSYMSSILLPTYLLGLDPTEQILSVSYGQGLSEEFAEGILNILGSETYANIFPQTTLKSFAKSKMLWRTDKFGYYKASSRDSSLTGFSGNTIIIDDILKNSNEAKSPTLLKSIEKTFDSTIYSRLTAKPNGNPARMLILMTRWTKADLIGYILKHDKRNAWTYLNIPALNEQSEPLWPEVHSKEFLLDIKERDPETFACLYQGQPGLEGTTEFNIADYHVIPRESSPYDSKVGYYISSWDTASKTGSNNDYTVGTLWKCCVDKIYLVDYVREKLTLPELKRLIAHKHEEWNCRYTLIEDANSGTGLIQILQEEHSPNAFIGIKANVRVKVPVVVPELANYNAVLKQFNVILDEMSAYPYGEHDDCVASVVNAIYYWALNLKVNTHHQFQSLSPRRKVHDLRSTY